MNKTIVAVVFLVAVASAQFCVDLVQDDTTCAAGTKTNWPAKVCNQEQVNITTSTYCDSDTGHTFWQTICPVQNTDTTSFCEGTGYYSYGFRFASLCGSGLQSCTADTDCAAAPLAETPPMTAVLACFECCTFCNHNDTCMMQLDAGLFSNDTATCSPCPAVTPQAVGAPVATNVPSVNQPSGSAPTSTPTVSKTPNSAVSVAVFSFVSAVIVAAVLLA